MTNPSAWLGVASRLAQRWMTGTATIYRYTETENSTARLTTTEATAVASVAMWVERSMLSPVEQLGVYEEPRVSQYIGHCALGTDIRRNDVVSIHGSRFRVLGVLSGPTHAGEMKVTMDIAVYEDFTVEAEEGVTSTSQNVPLYIWDEAVLWG